MDAYRTDAKRQQLDVTGPAVDPTRNMSAGFSLANQFTFAPVTKTISSTTAGIITKTRQSILAVRLSMNGRIRVNGSTVIEGRESPAKGRKKTRIKATSDPENVRCLHMRHNVLGGYWPYLFEPVVALALAGSVPAAMATMTIDRHAVNAIARDGSIAAITDQASVGSGVRFVDVARGKLLGIYDTDPATISVIRFCEKARDAFVHHTNGALTRVEIDTGRAAPLTQLDPEDRLAISPGCNTIAVFSPKSKAIEVRNLINDKRRNISTPLGTSHACFVHEDLLALLATSGAVRLARLGDPPRVESIKIGKAPISFGCADDFLALSSPTLELRAREKWNHMTSIPVVCDLADTCGISKSRAVVAAISDERGRPQKTLTFYEIGSGKVVEHVELPALPMAMAMSRDASIVITFQSRPPLLVRYVAGKPASIRLLVDGTANE